MALVAHLDPANESGTTRPERRVLQLETSGRRMAGGEGNVVIHNASTTGLLLETALPLEEGEALAVELPEAGTTLAQVVWRSGTLYGCQFDRPVSLAVLGAAELRSAPDLAGLGRADGESFGTRLTRLRKEQRLTLQQVADALQVAKPTVWAWEHDRSLPRPDRLGDLATALGVAPHELQDRSSSVLDLAKVTEAHRNDIAQKLGIEPQKIRIMIEL